MVGVTEQLILGLCSDGALREGVLVTGVHATKEHMNFISSTSSSLVVAYLH